MHVPVDVLPTERHEHHELDAEILQPIDGLSGQVVIIPRQLIVNAPMMEIHHIKQDLIGVVLVTFRFLHLAVQAEDALGTLAGTTRGPAFLQNDDLELFLRRLYGGSQPRAARAENHHIGRFGRIGGRHLRQLD